MHPSPALTCSAACAAQHRLYPKQASGAVSADKTDAQASVERIQNFEEAFARIRSATGIEDIEELVSLLLEINAVLMS